MSQTALDGGFDSPSEDAARAFRAALDAMARPGRIVRLGGASPAGLSAAAGTLALTLCDRETPVWLSASLAPAAADWLRFHTGAPLGRRAAAAFGFGRWEEIAPLTDWPAGTPDYPDRSATLVVELPALTGGAPVALTGPGIEGQGEIALPLPDGAVAALAANAARRPLGLDVFFTAGDRAMALPRSTRIGG